MAINWKELEKKYDMKQIDGIKSAIESLKLKHAEQHADNDCNNCGFNEEKISVFEKTNGEPYPIQFGIRKLSNNKYVCYKCNKVY